MTGVSGQNSDEPVIWIRCDDSSRLPAIADIADRLNQDGDAVRFVITTRNDPKLPHPKGSRAVRVFLTTQRPMLVILVGGVIDTQILFACEATQTPVIAVESRPDTLREMTGGWFRASARPALYGVSAAFATDARSADTLRKLGVPSDQVFAIGPFEKGGRILPHNDAERHEIAEKLRNRPVWLARAATLADVETLAVAHRHATRRSHRLLLVIIPERPIFGEDFAKAFKDMGYHVGRRSAGDEADETVQVYIADLDGEDGLWLRLAPICLAVGTMTRGAAHDPFEAAALGSVMVHGLRTQPFEDRFRRLLRAGASLGTAEPAKLGHAIEQLLSADRAAEMAVAGWEVTSSGAEISNKLVEMIQDRIDTVGLSHAAP